MRQAVESLLNYYTKATHKKREVVFGRNSFIDRRCVFEGHNAIGPGTRLHNCQVGTGTYLGRKVELSSVRIGRFCSIGSHIVNSAGRHPVKVFVSTHPAFFSKNKVAGFTFSREQKFEEIMYADYPMLSVIGNDVWIGDNVRIMDGVTIGDGAVIGANSMVNKDVAPYTINVGLPAKPISTRFDQDTIDFLLDFKWWNRDFNWIKEHHEEFSNITEFRNKFGK